MKYDSPEMDIRIFANTDILTSSDSSNSGKGPLSFTPGRAEVEMDTVITEKS